MNLYVVEIEILGVKARAVVCAKDAEDAVFDVLPRDEEESYRAVGLLGAAAPDVTSGLVCFEMLEEAEQGAGRIARAVGEGE